MEAFNMTVAPSPFVMGLTVAMEEQAKEDPSFDKGTINALKVSLMGPLSGIGDTFFWGIFRVLACSLGASFALQGNILGPIVLLLVFNIPNFLTRYYGLRIGYGQGAGFLDELTSSGKMNLFTYCAGIVGMASVGCLTASWIGISSPLVLNIAGNEITTDIIDHMAQQHNIHVGRTTADQIKFAVGSVLPELDEAEAPEPILVTGRNMVTGLPLEATIDYREISMCIDKTIAKIENEILKVLQKTPPELYSNIVHNGVWLAGGGSLLRGIAKRFAAKVNIPFHVAEDPLKAVARGTCLALKGSDRYPFMMK